MITLQGEKQIEHSAGDLAFFSTTNVPDRWLKVQGQALSADFYAELFQAIGYTFGGSGPTFYLPSLVRHFRVWNNSNSGHDSGRAVFSDQDDGIEDHTHGVILSGYGGIHYHIVTHYESIGRHSRWLGTGGSYANISVGSVDRHMETNSPHTHDTSMTEGSDSDETTPHTRMFPLYIYCGEFRRLSYYQGA